MVTIYLDIDGVLNPLGLNRRSAWPDAEYHDVPAGGTTFRLLLSRQLGAALTDLDADIVWATTWQEDAELVGDIVGIKDRNYLELGKGWKLGAIMDDLHDNPGPYVWIDDDEVDQYTASTLRREHSLPQLTIRPQPNIGLTPGDIESIKAFIRSST